MADRPLFHEMVQRRIAQLAELKDDVAAVQEMHRLRETLCQTIPLIPRPYRGRRPPNTAIIAYAAERAYRKRMEREAVQRFLSAPPQEMI